jgi:hypothetical protein
MKPVSVCVPAAFWNLSTLPEGCLEAWLVADGTQVEPGRPLAAVRVEGHLRKVTAPIGGRLRIQAKPNSVVDPGMPIAQINPAPGA